MHYAIDVPNFGDYGDSRTLAALARDAEDSGWDGFFIWDHIIGPAGAPVADTTVALAAIAVATRSIRFGPMVLPLPRRSPWKVAREAVSLDHLSDGRLVLGIGSGGDWFAELSTFGLARNDVHRAQQLDEGLAILTALTSAQETSHAGTHYAVKSTTFFPPPVQKRIPIWIAATWPKPRPLRRAAKYDGVVPVSSDIDIDLTPAQIRDVRSSVAKYRTRTDPFDVVAFGTTAGQSRDHDAQKVAPYSDAGATWWLEAPAPWKTTLDQVRARIRFGPPRI